MLYKLYFFLYVLYRIAIVISVFFVAIMFLWLIVCSFDRRVPVDNLTITLGEGIPGKKLKVNYTGYRKRQCYLKQTRTATDSHGQIVYTQTEERLVNGEFGYIDQTDYYPLDDDANIGKAVFTVYYRWYCPMNIAHYLAPITLEVSVNFYIKNKNIEPAN